MITDRNWAHVFILIARATTSPSQAKGEWEGFWCLSIQKAPESSFDDVFVTPDPALPQWFTLDPAQPLTITPA